MKTLVNSFPSQIAPYEGGPLQQPGETLFFDIETTGFSSRSCFVYLIGCACYENGSWQILQFLAETPEQEEQVLSAFLALSSHYSRVFHFNGSTFDVPFLQARCKKYRLPAPCFDRQTDLYRIVSPYKNLLHLPGCRQKQLEEYVGLHRADPFSGGDLVEVYHTYAQNGDEKLKEVLLTHNREDLTGLVQLSCLLALPALFEENGYEIGPAALEEGRFTLPLTLFHPLPVPLSCHVGPVWLAARDHTALLRILTREGTLRYFYPDYKNYSYLPDEDQAIHKSVAIYVDKSRRMPATASTCYTRCQGTFLPAPAGVLPQLPHFKAFYEDRETFLLLKEDFFSDPVLQRSYANAALTLLKKGS